VIGGGLGNRRKSIQSNCGGLHMQSGRLIIFENELNYNSIK
jgi:hypothetical protein